MTWDHWSFTSAPHGRCMPPILELVKFWKTLILFSIHVKNLQLFPKCPLRLASLSKRESKSGPHGRCDCFSVWKPALPIRFFHHTQGYCTDQTNDPLGYFTFLISFGAFCYFHLTFSLPPTSLFFLSTHYKLNLKVCLIHIKHFSRILHSGWVPSHCLSQWET